MVKEDGGRLGGTRSRRSLRLGTVLLAVSAAGAVAEAYDPIPENLRNFPWTWQARASYAAHQIRATSQADAGAVALTQHLAIGAQKTRAPALEVLSFEFEAPANHEPADPAYDGMVLGPQPYGRAGGNTTGEQEGVRHVGLV